MRTNNLFRYVLFYSFSWALISCSDAVNNASNDDPLPNTVAKSSVSFSAATSTVSENVLGGNATINVFRTGNSDGTITVNYETSNGTAIVGSDFTSSTGILTFNSGEVQKSIAISNDAIFEFEEYFSLTLSATTGDTSLGPITTHTVSITDTIISKFNNTVFSISPATDGSGDVFVGGLFTSYDGIAVDRVARINNDGTLDTTFIAPSIFNDSVYSIVATTDGTGDLYVGGRSSTGNGSPALVRLNTDGSIDSVFDTTSSGGFGGLNNFVVEIKLATDESQNLYVGGHFTSYKGTSVPKFVRLDSSGSIPTDFVTGDGFNDFTRAISPAVGITGDIYIGGNFTTFKSAVVNYLVRVDRSGNRVADFNSGTGFNGFVFSNGAAVDGSNDVYYGGRFTDYNGNAVKNIARINSMGTFDSTFDTGSGTAIGFNGDVYSIEPTVSGAVYVGGSFSSYKGVDITRLVRLTSTGAIDTSFVTGTGFNGQVETIALATDNSGDVFVGGTFTTYKGIVVNRIVRLNSIGNLVVAF